MKKIKIYSITSFRTSRFFTTINKSGKHLKVSPYIPRDKADELVRKASEIQKLLNKSKAILTQRKLNKVQVDLIKLDSNLTRIEATTKGILNYIVKASVEPKPKVKSQPLEINSKGGDSTGKDLKIVNSVISTNKE